VGASVAWAPGSRATFELESLPATQGQTRARLWIRPAASPTVEVGGLYLTNLGGERTRAELYARTANRWGPVAVELSGRFSDQRQGPEAADPGLALDARGWFLVVEPLAAFARYARSFGFLETDASKEEVDLVEGGARLEGAAGWLTASLWGARVEGALPSAVDAWGFAAEGAFERGPWSLSGALSRAHLAARGADVGPSPNLHGRLAVRGTKVDWEAFLELGLRTALEAGGGAPDLALLPGPVVDSPHLVVDARGAVALGAGFRLQLSVANVFDARWSPFGTGTLAPGLDLRVRLGWQPP
jgi:outer membrane receptor protein involved in Fe transport